VRGFLGKTTTGIVYSTSPFSPPPSPIQIFGLRVDKQEEEEECGRDAMEEATIEEELGCADLSEIIRVNSSLIFGVSSLNADHDTAYVIRGWTSCFICGFGLIGNILSAIVLTRPALRTLPINVILFFLTVCDTVYISLYLISWSIPTIIARLAMEEGDTVKLDNYYMTHWRPRFYPYLYPSLWTGTYLSSLSSHSCVLCHFRSGILTQDVSRVNRKMQSYYFFSLAAQNASVGFTILLTVERYIYGKLKFRNE